MRAGIFRSLMGMFCRGSVGHGGKTVKFRDDQIKTVQAAIDRAKKIGGAVDDWAALEVSVRTMRTSKITVTLDLMVEIVAAYMSSLDADQGVKFGGAVNARVTLIAAPAG